MKKILLMILFCLAMFPVVHGDWVYPFMSNTDGGFYCSFNDIQYDGNNERYDCQYLGVNHPTTTPNTLIKGMTGGSTTLLNSSSRAPYVNDTSSYVYGALGGNFGISSDSDTTTMTIDKVYYINATNLTFCPTNNDDFYLSMWNIYDDVTPNKHILNIADKSGSTILDEIVLYITTGSKINAVFQQQAGTRIEMTSSQALSTGTLYNIVFVYNSTSNLLKLYINGQYDTAISSSGMNICFDGNAPNHEYVFKTNSLASSSYMRGDIDEFILSQGSINSDGIYQLYHVANYSSLVYNADNQSDKTVIYDTGYQFDYNFTDAVDDITYYENSSYSSINSDGVFTFSDSAPVGHYDIRVNGTDGFDNWVYDDFSVDVINGIQFTDTCDSVTLYHTDNLSCQINATYDGVGVISWSVNDSRVSITGNDTESYLFDNPIVSDFNLPVCWNVSVTASASDDIKLYSFLYCINDTESTLNDISFTESIIYDNQDAIISMTVNDTENDNVTISVEWYVNAISVLSEDKQYNNTDTAMFTFAEDNYITGQIIRASISVTDGSNQYNYYNTTKTVMASSTSTGDIDFTPIAEQLEKNNTNNINFIIFMLMFIIIIGMFYLVLKHKISILKPLLIIIMFIFSIMFGENYNALFGFMMLLISCALSVIIYYM